MNSKPSVFSIGSLVYSQIHLLSFISNAVLERPVNNSQNFDSVAYVVVVVVIGRTPEGVLSGYSCPQSLEFSLTSDTYNVLLP